MKIDTSHLKTIIGPDDYRVFAGPDWPTYQDLIAGVRARNPIIQHEIEEFIAMMQENYSLQTKHGDELAEANQKRQRQVFFSKDYQGTPHCTIPWQTMGVNTNGDVFICESPSWVPKFVGNIVESQDVFQVLNSPLALSIRNEILQGRYSYCNNKICSFFSKIPVTHYRDQGPVHEPEMIGPSPDLTVDRLPANWIFDFDYTCNFQCPSCRTQVINNNRHHVIRAVNDRIVQAVKTRMIDRLQDENVTIRWCGGEPFISDVYLDLMDYIAATRNPRVRHVIQTNGSYLKKKSDLVQKLLPNMDEIRVSFDAASRTTYEKIRVNGRWNQLLDNVRWLRETINRVWPGCRLTADFVVQLANYQEIGLFVDLCQDLGVDRINWQKMWNWDTWTAEQFDHQNVYNTQHPLYPDLVRQFQLANQPMSLI